MRQVEPYDSRVHIYGVWLYIHTHSAPREPTKSRPPQALPAELEADNLRPVGAPGGVGLLPATDQSSITGQPTKANSIFSRLKQDNMGQYAVEKVNPQPDQFTSQIFLVPKKKDKSQRPVVNLTPLN